MFFLRSSCADGIGEIGMQAVFEKIIEKLEMQKDYYKTIRKNTYCRRTEMDDCDSCRSDHYLEARLSAIDDAIEMAILSTLHNNFDNVNKKSSLKCSHIHLYFINYFLNRSFFCVIIA